MEIIGSCFISTFMSDVQFEDLDLNNAVPLACVPSQPEMSSIVEETAARQFILTKKRLERAVKIYVASDKGSMRGISRFVKYLLYWCATFRRVQKILLDIDASGGTSEDCAVAIDHSMKSLIIAIRNRGLMDSV